MTMTVSYTNVLRMHLVLNIVGVINNIFISYHHRDENYKLELEGLLEDARWTGPNPGPNVAKNVSVSPGDIEPSLPDIHVRDLIAKNYITDATLMIVLLGTETYLRKHVDWEIAAGLENKCALLGLLLPEFKETYQIESWSMVLPPRLLDNVLGGYAALHSWDSWFSPNQHLTDGEDEDELHDLHQDSGQKAIETAFNDALERAGFHGSGGERGVGRQNSRPAFTRNRGRRTQLTPRS